jgi:hypothetical protein
MFKIIIGLTLLTLSSLAGTWLIEGTPTGIPSGTSEETLRLDQTVQQTISNGAVKVEGKYTYDEAYPPTMNGYYYTTDFREATGANVGGSYANTSASGFANKTFLIYADNYVEDQYGNKSFCSCLGQSSATVDGSSESSFSLVIQRSGGGWISNGALDYNYGFVNASGVLITVWDGANFYSKLFPFDVELIELTDATWTGWDLNAVTSMPDYSNGEVGGTSFYGYRNLYYPSDPGYNYGYQQYYIYAKRIVNGQEFYSWETSVQPSIPSTYYNDFYPSFTMYLEWYGDPSVESYIIYDYDKGRWFEYYNGGSDYLISFLVGDISWAGSQNGWHEYWSYPFTSDPRSPLIVKSNILLANNEVASVVINGEGQVVSTVSDPNTYAPLVVNSGVKVDNLNADSLDGYGGDAFVQSVSGTAPISVSAGKTPTVSHLDTNGYRHVPTNGTLNQILKNNGTGIASWGWVTEDKGVLSNASVIVVNASNSIFNARLSRDTNGVLAMTENHTYVATKGYHVKLNGSSIDLGGTIGGGDGAYTISANWWCKGPPTGATHRIFCNSGNNHYFQISTNANGTHIDFVYNYYGYTKLNYSHPISSFSSGWNMLTVRKGYWGNADETVRLYLNGTMISSLYSDTPNWYIDIRYVAGAASSTYAPQYPIDEIAIWFGDYYKNITDTQIAELYNVGRGGIPTYMGDYLASAGYYITAAWPYTFQQPQYLFRFDTNDGTQARNAIGNTLCNFTAPGNVDYFEGEVCFKKVPKTQNLISCTGYPTGSVTSVTTTIGDNNFNTVIAGADIKLTPPRWQDTVVSGIALRSGGTSPTRELVILDSGIYGTGFALNEDSDFAAQVQHGVASTSASFPDFYYNPHIHCSVSSVTAPETNATFVLTWQIAPVFSNFLGTSVSRTSTVSWAGSETNQHKLVSFGFITNNLLQGADSLIFRGNIKRIATPTLANDVPAKVIVDSLDYHFPFDSIGSTAIFGDAP